MPPKKHLDEAAIIARYQSGELTMSIALAYGISDTLVRTILRRNGIVPSHAKRPVSPDQDRQMLEMHHYGMWNNQIAHALGIASCTVSTRLSAMGVRVGPHPYKLTAEQRCALAIQYEVGATFKMLEKEYGVSCTIIRSCLDEFMVPHRTGWGRFRTPEWVDQLGRKHVFHSRWEQLYAGWLDSQGMRWDYEGRKFKLCKCHCYTPDFVVTRADGGIEYHEVKGWLDDRTVNRMLEFVRMYPDHVLIMVGPRDLHRLGLIEDWYLRHPMAQRVEDLKSWLSALSRSSTIGKEVSHG